LVCNVASRFCSFIQKQTKHRFPGEEEPRQIISGLRQYYEVDDLNDRSCLVVCNIPYIIIIIFSRVSKKIITIIIQQTNRKAKVCGIESFGMVLCGIDSDKSMVEFVEPPSTATVGERVLIDDEENEEPWRPNRIKKKKVWKKLSPELKLVKGKAMFRDVPLTPLSGGYCHTGTAMCGDVR